MDDGKLAGLTVVALATSGGVLLVWMWAMYSGIKRLVEKTEVGNARLEEILEELQSGDDDG